MIPGAIDFWYGEVVATILIENSIDINVGASNGWLFVSDGDSNWWTVAYYPANAG